MIVSDGRWKMEEGREEKVNLLPSEAIVSANSVEDLRTAVYRQVG
jgi:hypothetical protein